MFAFIRGTLVEKGVDNAVLETPGGVAYEVQIAESERPEFPDSGSTCRLFTHLYVREDRMQLYGFINRSTRDFFRQLLPQKGIGPKLAMSVLSELGSDKFRSAIHQQDIDQLTRVKGVGKKTARRLIVEMAEKLPRSPGDGDGAPDPVEEEAVQALIGLGFRQNEATRAVSSATEEQTPEDVETLISRSLTFLEAAE